MKTHLRLLPLLTIALATCAAAQTIGAPAPAAMPQLPVPPPPALGADSYVLMDYQTGDLIAHKNMHERLAPASLTKLMTAYVVDAALASGKVHWDDPVYISEHAWKKGGAVTDGSTSFLKLHQRYPLSKVYNGMIVQSGNDAAIALAEHVAGSEGAFVQLMNDYAQRLGMTGTHFENASGYPHPDHYTTAYDLGLLARAIIADFPQYYGIYKIPSYTISGIKQGNRNLLLYHDPSVDGLKTGSTAEAGFCLVASALRHGQRMIGVVMKTKNLSDAASEDEALLNYGFSFFSTHTLYASGRPLATPRLWEGAANRLPVGVAQAVEVTLPRGHFHDLKTAMNLPATLIAPFRKGETVGTLTVSLDGKQLMTAPLVALADAPQAGLFGRLYDEVFMWFHEH
ncbi:MAG TPA: D-alanyl-D-alanine carboxypeptidase family protein [Steroidobacteraceae bacterium]|nr:D-alanyl-D-alanine carboxypeptidase family protein [Steroidobacteraceae bacterium]